MKILCAAGLHAEAIEQAACLACALAYQAPPCGFSYPLLMGLYASVDDRSHEVHVTDLVTCLRKSYYAKTEPAPTNPRDLVALMIGKALHLWLETAMQGDPHYRSEAAVDLDGLMGRIDFIGNGQIIDLKTTSWLTGDKAANADHSDQVNIYRALAPQDAARLDIQYLDKYGPTTCRTCRVSLRRIDGVETCPRCGYRAPRGHGGAVLAEVELKDPEAVRRFALLRKTILELALENREPPDPEPGWICRYCAYSQCPHNRSSS